MNIPVRRGKEVKAGRGTVLRCKGWRQEAILRLLENNLENGEDPENLIVYTGAKAARSWKDFDLIVAALKELECGQTLLCQSGRAVAKFRSHERAPPSSQNPGGFLISSARADRFSPRDCLRPGSRA